MRGIPKGDGTSTLARTWYAPLAVTSARMLVLAITSLRQLDQPEIRCAFVALSAASVLHTHAFAFTGGSRRAIARGSGLAPQPAPAPPASRSCRGCRLAATRALPTPSVTLAAGRRPLHQSPPALRPAPGRRVVVGALSCSIAECRRHRPS